MTAANAQSKLPNTYYFIENRYPQEDPNLDLNFDNDILYSDIVDVDVDKYDTPYMPQVTPDKSKEKKDLRINKPKKGMNYNIFFYFILAIIILMLLWYLYKGKTPEKKNIIDMYPDDAELTMMSPDIGMGSRFARVK